MVTVGGERVECLRVVWAGGDVSELWARCGTPITLDDESIVTARRESDIWPTLTEGQRQQLRLILSSIVG